MEETRAARAYVCGRPLLEQLADDRERAAALLRKRSREAARSVVRFWLPHRPSNIGEIHPSMLESSSAGTASSSVVSGSAMAEETLRGPARRCPVQAVSAPMGAKRRPTRCAFRAEGSIQGSMYTARSTRSKAA